ncbi:MAG: nicotinate-nucleotide--dimethylbenzimidazole phosphoribosyltransferase [Maricaulaceae bacterium]
MTDSAPNTAKPFDDIRALVESMPHHDDKAPAAVQQAFDSYSPALSAFGNLGPALRWLAGWQAKMPPSIDRPLVAVFAGTHGVASEYTSGDPVDIAKKRVRGLTERKAAVRGIAGSYGAAFKVYEMGVEYPSANLTKEASLSERDCAAAIAFGMEVVAEGADIIVLGNAGFGSATAAAAIARGLYGGAAEYWAGGRDASASARIEAVKKGAELQKDHLFDPLDVLRCFGGRDIAGLMGAIIAARHQSIPVILDGYVVCAAAAVLHRLDPNAISHCYAGHISSEPAHGALLDRMGLTPLMGFEIGIGDGTGGALAMGTLKAAASGLRTIME